MSFRETAPVANTSRSLPTIIIIIIIIIILIIILKPSKYFYNLTSPINLICSSTQYSFILCVSISLKFPPRFNSTSHFVAEE
jgi:hypothetical protein